MLEPDYGEEELHLSECRERRGVAWESRRLGGTAGRRRGFRPRARAEGEGEPGRRPRRSLEPAGSTRDGREVSVRRRAWLERGLVVADSGWGRYGPGWVEFFSFSESERS
jgi:hypothetical protein